MPVRQNHSAFQSVRLVYTSSRIRQEAQFPTILKEETEIKFLDDFESYAPKNIHFALVSMTSSPHINTYIHTVVILG